MCLELLSKIDNQLFGFADAELKIVQCAPLRATLIAVL